MFRTIFIYIQKFSILLYWKYLFSDFGTHYKESLFVDLSGYYTYELQWINLFGPLECCYNFASLSCVINYITLWTINYSLFQHLNSEWEKIRLFLKINIDMGLKMDLTKTMEKYTVYCFTGWNQILWGGVF